MKKIAIAFISALLLIGMTACQQGNAPENAEEAANTAGNVEATTQANDANAAPAAPKIPGYQEKAEAMAKTTVAFSEEEYDFGQVKDGEIVRHNFTFTNSGETPLVIQRAKASCGCTVPTWTKEPVAPGETGEIAVEFNSKNKPGMQTKTITVTANFDGGINKVLRIKGEVLPADAN
jgi:hypothetical protein